MSKKFTKTLEEKFGLSGKKGLEGEQFFKQFYESKGYIVTHYDDDVVFQIEGVDFLIDTGKNFYTVDVKNNLTLSNTIYVECNEDGWLYNPKKKSQFISHVNPSKKIIATYRRSTMQSFLQDFYWDYRGNLINFPLSALPFVKIEEQ